ncbi:MAG: SseB family protein, partial [Lentisphaeria bacterium]
IKELLQSEQTSELLQKFVVEKFAKMGLMLPLRNLSRENSGVKEFSIDDVLIITGPDQRPYLPVFAHDRFLEKLKADTGEELKDLVALSGVEILSKLPNVCGIAINPGTDCFIALMPQK